MKSNIMKPIEKEIIKFSVLKELSNNGNIPTSQDYGIDDDCYVYIFKDMVNAHFLNPKRVLFNILGGVEIDNQLDLVTGIGNHFIESHEGWNKIYNNLDDLNKLLDGWNK